MLARGRLLVAQQLWRLLGRHLLGIYKFVLFILAFACVPALRGLLKEASAWGNVIFSSNGISILRTVVLKLAPSSPR